MYEECEATSNKVAWSVLAWAEAHTSKGNEMVLQMHLHAQHAMPERYNKNKIKNFDCKL